jgi:Fe-S cluster biogenesis protein NfuA
LAKEVGGVVREHIGAGETVVVEGFEPDLTDEEKLRIKVQVVVDKEINPGIAMHGGFVTILDVQGQKVFIKMGGGCQGCGSADVTLKQGVERMIRDNVPEVEAVLDSTDHASGLNPYYQPGAAPM